MVTQIILACSRTKPVAPAGSWGWPGKIEDLAGHFTRARRGPPAFQATAAINSSKLTSFKTRFKFEKLILDLERAADDAAGMDFGGAPEDSRARRGNRR